MRIISPRRLREFWLRHPQAEAPLKRWLRIATAARWATINDVRVLFPTADGGVAVDSGHLVTVFNVGGNDYRLIAAIHYNTGVLYVLRVLTHREYDRGNWKAQL